MSLLLAITKISSIVLSVTKSFTNSLPSPLLAPVNIAMFLIKSSDLFYIYNVKLDQVFELNNKSYNDHNGGYMLQKINGK